MTERTPVVDAHHHFWTPGRYDYYWMNGPDLEPIRRAYGPADLQPLLTNSGVDYTVLVQTVPSVAETREFLEIARDTPFVAGVVGWVDLTDQGVGQTLEELKAGPGGRYLVGIRHMVHDEPDDEWLLRPDVQRGLQAVAHAGLAYDLLLRPRELPAALEVVKAHPHLRFVVDHLAKPEIAAGEIVEWTQRINPFRDQTHVWCKLSGMVTEANWTSWTPEDLRPYVATALDVFGIERVMFGSDWPVSLLAADYAQVKSALELALPRLSVADEAAIIGGNAIRFYRLDV
ncbi:MAG: amidohydrolase family protein [Thermomicrobiales bacterium]|nr:amidohydrolase family protein [Thermomicrobiales bacterium]